MRRRYIHFNMKTSTERYIYMCDFEFQEEKEKEKKKRKIRLEMHYDQVFLDGNDAYVWLYNPTPW